MDYASDDEYDRGAAGGGGGAILGVLMTLVIGCGLVFAAYKLGQRTSVDDPPLLIADAGEAKMVPINEGGTAIANQDNDAYTMIDALRRSGDATAESDGIVVSDRLPDRALASAGSLPITAVQEDALRIDELQLASSIDGEPSLSGNAVPDRTGDLELAGGAEVQVADSEAVLRAETAASEALRVAEREVAVLEVTTPEPLPDAPVPPLTRAADTELVLAEATSAPDRLTEEDFGQGIVLFPVPRSKPDLARRPNPPTRTAETPPPSAGVRQPSAAAATTIVPVVIPVPVQPGRALPPGQTLAPGQALAPGLQVQPVRIPSQPVGDAQVQLGAMPTSNQVRARWQQLRAQNPDLLGQLGIQVQPVRTAQGQNLFRLRAGPLRDSRQAAQLCDQLRVRGIECFVPAR